MLNCMQLTTQAAMQIRNMRGLTEQPCVHEETLLHDQPEADAPAEPDPCARETPADPIPRLIPSKLKAQLEEFFSVAVSNDSADAHFHARAALEGLRSSIANAGIITALSSGTTLAPNPGAAKAPLGRHKDWLEKYHDQARKKARHNGQSAQLPSDKEIAQAEMCLLKSKPRPKKPKEQCVLAELQAATLKASNVLTSCPSGSRKLSLFQRQHLASYQLQPLSSCSPCGSHIFNT